MPPLRTCSSTLYCAIMRILVNFMQRNDWHIHCLAEDCKTRVSEWITVRRDETLLRLLQACGATPAELGEVARSMVRLGRGSTYIDVNETGRRLLRILPQA
jgi:hypothetical protein